MCATCGCSEAGPALRSPGHHHHHEPHAHDHGRTVRIEEAVLGRNDALAAHNRAWFKARGILAVNVVSSPGAGKTTVVVRAIRELEGRLSVAVIEGDQATSRDADRVRATGAAVVQVNTGPACHLDAHMVAHALEELGPRDGSCVVIENVGNLICPAMFDLGEEKRILVASVTEGEDKPVKYPHMFRSADAVLLNKMDLLPYVAFDVDRFLGFVKEVNPRCQVFPVSATKGEGLPAWYDWLCSFAGREMAR